MYQSFIVELATLKLERNSSFSRGKTGGKIFLGFSWSLLPYWPFLVKPGDLVHLSLQLHSSQTGPSAGGGMRYSMLKHLCNHQVWLWYLDLSQVFLVSVLIWEIMSNQLSRLCILNSSPRNLDSHLGLDLSSWTSLLTDRAPSHKPNSPPEDTATMISIIHHAYSQETQRGTFPKLGWFLILLQNRYKNYPHLSDPAYRQQKN